MPQFKLNDGRHITSHPTEQGADVVYYAPEVFECPESEAETLRKDPIKFTEVATPTDSAHLWHDRMAASKAAQTPVPPKKGTGTESAKEPAKHSTKAAH